MAKRSKAEIVDDPEIVDAAVADEGDSEDEDDVLLRAREAYDRARDWWSDNFQEAKEDLRFARLNEQWPEDIKRERQEKGRPCETFNRLPAFIRQVVNDSRQNKPAIKVHPQDSSADPRTAEIINGLIRNIETTSDADVAYDTAIDQAVSQGFGYWRINTRYARDDAFDQDIVFERIPNAFSVYGDPRSTAADSSDWNEAFVVSTMPKKDFEATYPKAQRKDWDTDFNNAEAWLEGDDVVVAEYWTREKVMRLITALSDGSVIAVEEFEEKAEEYAARAISMVGSPREVESCKVTQRVMTGAEVLKTVDWAGSYIPIIPVYGDEVFDEKGKRHFRSLIRDTKGLQRTYNYLRNTGIEGLGLQPRIPYIGEQEAFSIDPNWSTANSESHPYLMIPKGAATPQRQPLPSHFAAALQEALTVSDEMKAVIGLYDPSLGQRSNETSGTAIRARQMEGDVSTFHFIDNLTRAIRHGGRVLLDLIPKVYTTERMVRILGEDMQPQNVPIAPSGQPVTERDDGHGNMLAIYDPTVGKYDLTVSSGPSYTSRRAEVAAILTEVLRSVPGAAPFLGHRLAKVLDLPDADELAEEMKTLNPAHQQGMPPEVQAQMDQMKGLIQQGAQTIVQMQQQLAESQRKLADKSTDHVLEKRKLDIEAHRAETERIKAATAKSFPLPPGATEQLAPLVTQMVQDALASPDILSPPALNGAWLGPEGQPTELRG